MPATFKVKFLDGEVREVIRQPIHQVRAEAVSGASGGSGSLTFVWAMLWAADTGGRGTRSDFEKWLTKVEDFEPVIEDEGADDADPPASGGTTSPT